MDIIFTYNDDMAEGVSLPDGRAVPPVVSELLLALQGGDTYTIPYGHHGVRRRPTHIPLAWRQSWHSTADYVGSQCHHTWRRPETRLYQF